MKSLLKERDRLISSLGCHCLWIYWLLDIGSILPSTETTSSDDETFPINEPSPFNQDLQQQHMESIREAERRIQEHPERYEGHSLLQRVAESERISGGAAQVAEMPPPDVSLSRNSSRKSPLGVDSVDYRRIWMNNNIATVIAHIETGQLLKGNNMFMKWILTKWDDL